eukprot:SAG22_NODE_1028_length_5942_cov_3.188088_2_plen_267_part_00
MFAALFTERHAEARSATIGGLKPVPTTDWAGGWPKGGLSPTVRTDRFLRAEPAGGSSLAGGWSRVPSCNSFRAGESLGQAALYLAGLPAESPAAIGNLAAQLSRRLVVAGPATAAGTAAAQLPPPPPPPAGVLARCGECAAGGGGGVKAECWAAAAAIPDPQFKFGPGIGELGVLSDIRLASSKGQQQVPGRWAVTAEIMMPHPGRPQYMFLGKLVAAALNLVDGVGSVEVVPASNGGGGRLARWSAGLISLQGRTTMGFARRPRL